MQIHELNNYSGSLDDAYLAADNGSDTGKMKTTALTDPLNARIDNILAGPAPSAEEIVDARRGGNGVNYSSLGEAIRAQYDLAVEDASNWAKLEGVEIVAGNLIPLATEKGRGGFFWDGSSISPITYSNFKYYKIPVDSETVYTLNHPSRWWVSVDANNEMVAYGEADDIVIPHRINTGANAVSLWITYNYVNFPDIAIYKGLTVPENTQTIYQMPAYVLPYLYQSITPDMIKGFEYGDLKAVATKEYSDSYAFASTSGVVPSISLNAALDVYELKCEAETYYFSENVRFLTAIDENGKSVAASSDYATSYDNTSGTAKTLLLSIAKTKFETTKITKGSPLNIYNHYPDWLEELRGEGATGKFFDHFAGDYTGEIKLNKIISAVASNVEYAFDANIPGWASESVISFVLYNAVGTESIRFDVSASSIKLTDNNYGNPTTETVLHGLTVANTFQLHIKMTLGRIFSVELTSNGERYTHEFTTSKRFATYPSIIAAGVTPTDCSFTWGTRDIQSGTWCFGDSYFGATTQDRWVYYLNQAGYYDGKLFDAYPGGNSPTELASLRGLLTVGKPKRIFWALGMNDGSDVDSAPRTVWKNSIDAVMSLCENNGIELILATIPSVPSINNEAKNSYVRNSGYQYVDFAKAVGADGSGVWFSGMLSGDGVHPTAKGALTLYNRVLSDFQQITIFD